MLRNHDISCPLSVQMGGRGRQGEACAELDVTGWGERRGVSPHHWAPAPSRGFMCLHHVRFSWDYEKAKKTVTQSVCVNCPRLYGVPVAETQGESQVRLVQKPTGSARLGAAGRAASTRYQEVTCRLCRRGRGPADLLIWKGSENYGRRKGHRRKVINKETIHLACFFFFSILWYLGTPSLYLYY